jgi:hypothetical protein
MKTCMGYEDEDMHGIRGGLLGCDPRAYDAALGSTLFFSRKTGRTT